ncbi:MAG: nucleotide exchange factor GrpE [Ruminococcus sp.]|jgi:grpE|nr:MAG: nucleotide exchange factor GrpE [Ruminococcus sp.]
MAEEVKDPSQQTSEAEESMKNAAEAAETDAAADVATETEAAAAEADKTAELQQKIEALEKELADEKEKYLRLDAEYYNYRTRSLKEKQDAYDNALTKAVTEVLSVIDNFERALTAECADANFKKGVEMIFRQYTAILEKLGVKEIEAEGKPFDPNFHNAVSQITDENLGENTVAAVLRKGYIMGNKVIRHAMVTVANP